MNHMQSSHTITILELRENFIKYFRSNHHKLLKPSKVFNNDPSLLFVNAGMNQLKDVFLGKIEQDPKFVQLCNSQVCIRAGGKHNDLDDVGLDSYHLTSFEMLGSWSINSYGKQKAIELAITYLTEHLKLDKKRIYVTYFEGVADIPEDVETRDIWKDHIHENHIVKGNFKDNFWMMADVGPCGVCTEIHYDNRNISENEYIDCPELVNKGDPNVIEIWNNVFMEYYRDHNGLYTKLNKFYVDTGMGLERLAMILQRKKSLYMTDAFSFLMGYAQALTNQTTFYSDEYNENSPNYNIDCAYRIFCDHIRTIVVALFDDVEFDATKRGFVLRKIFRRMMTYVYIYLNNNKVEHLMIKPIIKGLIHDILCYGLKKQHDYNVIQQKLIDEEHMFIGKLRNVKAKVLNIMSSKSKKLHDVNNVNNSGEVDIYETLKKDGIPIKIIDSYDSIIFIDNKMK